MVLLVWNEEMSVGLPRLDEDHQILIRVINSLESQKRDEGDPELLRTTFEHLKSYAQFHFAREEAVMRRVGYDALDDHQNEHRAFEERMEELSAKLEAAPEKAASEINDELLNFLTDWLQHHILVIDMTYKPLVLDNAQAARAADEFKPSHHWWN